MGNSRKRVKSYGYIPGFAKSTKKVDWEDDSPVCPWCHSRIDLEYPPQKHCGVCGNPVEW